MNWAEIGVRVRDLVEGRKSAISDPLELTYRLGVLRNSSPSRMRAEAGLKVTIRSLPEEPTTLELLVKETLYKVPAV